MASMNKYYLVAATTAQVDGDVIDSKTLTKLVGRPEKLRKVRRKRFKYAYLPKRAY